MDRHNRLYAKALGCIVNVNSFDGGMRVVIHHRSSSGVVTWAGSFEWGDEGRFNDRIRDWLDSLPWPHDDDPRVAIAEGSPV